MQVDNTNQKRHSLWRLLAPWKVLAGLAIVAIAAVLANGQASAGLGLPPGSGQAFSVQVKQVSQPADRLDISFGKPTQDLKVLDVFAISSDAASKGIPCRGRGLLTNHRKDVNPPPLTDHEVWTVLFPDKCLGNYDEVVVLALPVDPNNHLVIKDVALYNTNGTPEDLTDDIWVGTGNAKKLDWGKFPRLSNLWLCTQPPAVRQCNGTIIYQVLGQPITSPDPKDPSVNQQLGAFEYELRFDSKFLDVELIPLALGDNGNANGSGPTCLTNHREGIVNLACVTKGKDHPFFAPNALSVAVIRPKPDVYSILIANQENGIATQLINQDCQLADLQGHPIPLDGLDVCQDGAVTIRYLEGDIHADCQVDVLDQQQIAFRWGSRLGNLLYNSRFDLEPSQPKKGDGDIDAKDLQFVYGRHGSTCHDPWPKQAPVDPKAKPVTPTPTPSIPPPARPDLQVTFDGPPEFVDNICRLSFTVTNKKAGSTAAASVLRVEMDWGATADEAVPELTGGASVSVAAEVEGVGFGCVFDPDLNGMAKIDATEAVDENDETNNEAEIFWLG